MADVEASGRHGNQHAATEIQWVDILGRVPTVKSCPQTMNSEEITLVGSHGYL
jgi:hypothetical protein